MLIGDIARRNARRYPEKTAIISGSARFTFKQFNDRVNSIANALLDMGTKKGDKIAVLMDNCHQYVELYCAAPKAGMVLVPLSSALPAESLRYIINQSGANALILEESYLETAEFMRAELPSVKNFTVVGTPPQDMESYDKLVSVYPPREPEVEVDEEDIVYLIYTSGTTGLPKGIMRTHKDTIATTVNYMLTESSTHDDIGLAIFPVSWAGVIFPQMLPHLYMGCTFILAKGFQPGEMLGTIQKEKVTSTFIVSPMITSLLDYPDLNRYDTGSLRLMLVGGAPVPAEILKRAIGVFGNIFLQLYGLAEHTPITSLSTKELDLDSPAGVEMLRSCGREAINLELRIVDEDDNDVPPGEVGEVITRGDNMMKGYWEAPQATADTIRDGWLHTGDLARMDEEGYVYLMDRKKDTIISGGKTIYSSQVEGVLYRHPSIKEAAAIGVPHEKLGEQVKAVVVLNEGAKTTENEIIDFCKKHLEAHAMPESVEFINELPKNPTGKVLKRTLRERYV